MNQQPPDIYHNLQIEAGFVCLCFFTFSSSSPALIASSVGTPSSSSSAVPSIDLFTCFINALMRMRETKHSHSAQVDQRYL